MLFHIISVDHWNAAKVTDEYAPAGLETEGFIHLSKLDQVLHPANLLYAGQQDLQLLVISPEKLVAEVVFEPGSHGEAELFPHLFGPLNINAVVDVVAFPCGADGRFVLPDGLPDSIE